MCEEVKLFRRRTHCPMCHKECGDARELFSVAQMDMEMRVLCCPVCGLAFKEYVPTAEMFNRIYTKDYAPYQESSDGGEMINRVHRMGGATRKTHLDYGCGNGSLVRTALSLGWESYGSDPYLPDGVVPSGRFFKNSPATTMPVPTAPFDVISLWAVVEHLDHPLDTFTWLATQLKKNGRMIFNVPNGDSLIARKHGRDWRIAQYLDHTVFFTRKTVKWLACTMNVRVMHCDSCGTPWPFGRGKEYVSKKETVKTHGAVGNGMGTLAAAQLVGRNRHLRGCLRWVVNTFRLGDHLYVVYEKDAG